MWSVVVDQGWDYPCFYIYIYTLVTTRPKQVLRPVREQSARCEESANHRRVGHPELTERQLVHDSSDDRRENSRRHPREGHGESHQGVLQAPARDQAQEDDGRGRSSAEHNRQG